MERGHAIQLYGGDVGKLIYKKMQKQEPREERSQQEQESLHRSLRFVEEICHLLKLSRPCTKTSMDYFYHLSNSENHQFQIEIMIGAAIFLSAKIFQTERKIRDILNMIFSVTSLHRILMSEQENSEEEGKVVTMNDLILQGGLNEAIQPTYSLNNYNEFKSKILEAEQYLLRVLGFDFSQSQKNLSEMKSILIIIHQLRLPQVTAQAIMNAYNDLPFTGAEKWIAGVIFFGYVIGRVAQKGKEVHEEVVIKDEEWEAIFCTKIEKLINYANKLATYYEKKLTEKQKQSQLNNSKHPPTLPHPPAESNKNSSQMSH